MHFTPLRQQRTLMITSSCRDSLNIDAQRTVGAAANIDVVHTVGLASSIAASTIVNTNIRP